MPARQAATLWAGVTLCLTIGALAAITELCIGTRLDRLALWLAAR